MGIIMMIVGLIAFLLSYRPGVSISTTTVPTPRATPTDTGVWFVAGLADTGPLGPVDVYSMSDVNRIYAAFGRQAYASLLYDALDAFFHEGGYHAVVSRVVGPARVFASHNLLDNVAAISLVVTAKGPGSYGNNYKVAVTNGVQTGYRIQVTDASNNVLETSPDLSTQMDAVNWSQFSAYVNIALGVSANVPIVAAAAALAGGNDDRASVTSSDYTTALNLLSKALGPGQVSAPGQTSDTTHAVLTLHAANNNRVAILDLPDTATAATLESSAAAARTNGQWAAAFTPWLQAPGVTTGAASRVIAPSAFIAALCARNDGIYNPDQPYAGALGIAGWFTGLSQAAFDDATRQTLNASSVNVIRNLNGQITNYGWRSIVDPVATPDWIDFGNVRLAMAIAAQGWAIGQQFIFQQLDGAGLTIGKFAAALTAMLQGFYRQGALYGVTPDDAFYVDVGPTVNTPTTIANNELHAILNVKMSPMAEFVQLTIDKVPITEAV